MKKVDDAYFEELVKQVTNKVKQIDAHISPLIDRDLEEIDVVEKAILRLGTYELENRLDIPYKVVINEAVELTKTFGAEEGYRFVNGIMDKLAAKLRSIEVQASKK